ncbi:sensor histidine kinase [Pseudoroseomonas ludipueritiae]|uniref:histidine kinase n=1 Tax=Pseudoroseomonas ludipueritiae TaxID=198093 RepID=A0ABR7R3B1_9PROT|nr:HWE histidine kinase domain-containing protein [Pseudoroseomonas ludipueritiae]MBC9176242.1 PAS domain-containing protein [Pseudoroseomonas ludipueritiae]
MPHQMPFWHKVIRRLPRRPLPTPQRYGLAALMVLAAGGIRLALPVLGLPYLFFIPPVMAVAFLLGIGPGLFATALATLLAVGLFIPPYYTFFISLEQWTATALFALVTASIALVCAAFRRILDTRDADLARLRQALADAAGSRAEADASAAFLGGVLASSADCITVLDLDARLAFMSEGGRRSMEVADFAAIHHASWPELWRGEARARAEAAVAEARAGRTARFQGLAHTMRGRPLWWDVAVTPMLDGGGQPERLLCVARDITAQRQLEEQLELLNQELRHRLKNTLAMAQAVMNQTLRQSSSLPEAREALEARMIALGRAQGGLLDIHNQGAEIHEVVRGALLPHDGRASAFRVEGPSLRLSSRCALALTLALHELATNAAKYGALSVEGGRVMLCWRILPPFDGAEASFQLRWEESGGPAVQPPSRNGFGSFMIRRTLPGYFEGSASLEFPPHGLLYQLEGPVAALHEEQGRQA